MKVQRRALYATRRGFGTDDVDEKPKQTKFSFVKG
jgi:hypothetical protein